MGVKRTETGDSLVVVSKWRLLLVKVFISKNGNRLPAAFDDIQVFEQDHAHQGKYCHIPSTENDRIVCGETFVSIYIVAEDQESQQNGNGEVGSGKHDQIYAKYQVRRTFHR